MKFLVMTKQSTPPPPEMVVPIVQQMGVWVNKYTDNGIIKETWAFAGMNAGGGIVEVASLDELDKILSEFPLWTLLDGRNLPLGGRGELSAADEADSAGNDGERGGEVT